MKATQALHDLGQSIWLDNITRELLASGTLGRYIRDFSVTGLTSNPTTFDHAIRNTDGYDAAILAKKSAGKSGEALFLELALEDLSLTADLLRPIHDTSGGLDGWVSLEISPFLANDVEGSIKAVARLHLRAQRPNVFIKIPGTPAGMAAAEDAIFAGVPVNFTLLFSREHYLAAAEAYMRGIERRMAAGFGLKIASVASVFVSRWDAAANGRVPQRLRNRLGIAIAMRTYAAYRAHLASPRWHKLAAAGAQPQRLLWASTGSKEQELPETYYVQALAAADTISTLPEKTLLALALEDGMINTLTANGGDAELVLAEFAGAGIDIDSLAAALQRDGTKAFSRSWRDIMEWIDEKGIEPSIATQD